MSEQLWKKHFKEKYGEFTVKKLNGGYTNQTFLLEGTDPLLVAKIASSLNSDIKNEVNCLKLIAKTGLSPVVHDFITSGESFITVMNFLEGTNGQSVLDNDKTERTKELYRQLGKSLAKDIHSERYRFQSEGINESNLQEMDLELSFVPDDLIESSREILFHTKDSKKEWVLTHGDYGIHNVLFTENQGLSVLDWEWAEWANPLADISWVCWFTSLHYPKHSTSLNNLFLKEYQKHSSLSITPEALKGFAVYKVWKVLYRIENAPQSVQKEWTRRLNWTLDTEFI